MRTRREFLSGTVAGVATLAFGSMTMSARVNRPLGVQLFTVRKLAETDLPGVLEVLK